MIIENEMQELCNNNDHNYNCKIKNDTSNECIFYEDLQGREIF